MKEYNTMVISGGALKGFAILGCLQCLEDKKLTHNICKYIATSVGAFISYLLCIGYTPIEIMVSLSNNNWMEKMSNLDYVNILYGGSASSFTIITELLEKLTIEKIGKLVNLGELLKMTGKQLICCTFNMTKYDLEFINPIENPDMPCLVALRMSANLPILFEPFLYNSCYYLDGGLIANFPLFKIDLSNDNAIGIKFKIFPADIKKINNLQYLYEVIKMPCIYLENQFNKDYLEKCDIIEITIKDGSSSLNFKLSMNDRLEMFSNGYETAKKFIDNLS